MVFRICQTLTVSERWAYRLLEQARSTQRHNPHVRGEEELVARVIKLVIQYGKYG